MWKFVTRGIRESLERRVCRTNVYSQSNQDSSGNNSNDTEKSLVRCSKKFGPPSCFAAFYHHGYARGRCGSKLGHHDRHRRRNYDANYTWSEAVGWSSVLAIGYVVCQSLCIRRKLFEIDGTNLEKWKKKLIINPQNQAAQLLSHFLLPRPQYILPVNQQSISKQSPQLTEISEDLIDGPVSIEKEYGPITVDEALKEAVNEFSQAHQLVLGELEFSNGLKAIEEKRYEDAVEHFITGAKMSSAGSMFNLGLCYELGLGTPKDYVKAAKYYKKAANVGHVDAMYNLGVFHAQGKGGIDVNLNVARHWFTEAAHKGKIEAIKALQLEQNFEKQTYLKHKSEQAPNHLKIKKTENIKENVMTKLTNFSTIFNNNANSQSTESEEYSSSYDEDSSSSPSPTDIFLEMLGAHEQNIIPLISLGRDGH